VGVFRDPAKSRIASMTTAGGWPLHSVKTATHANYDILTFDVLNVPEDSTLDVLPVGTGGPV